MTNSQAAGRSPGWPAELALVWRAGTEDDPAVTAFLDALG
jgi:DNA-binding transcriptional LysR family regulator